MKPCHRLEKRFLGNILGLVDVWAKVASPAEQGIAMETGKPGESISVPRTSRLHPFPLLRVRCGLIGGWCCHACRADHVLSPAVNRFLTILTEQHPLGENCWWGGSVLCLFWLKGGPILSSTDGIP